MSVRVDSEDCTRLAMLARLDDTSPADQSRKALDVYFERRMADPALPAKIEAAKRRYAQTLEILTSDVTVPESPKSVPIFNASKSEQMTLRIDAATYARLSAFCLVDDNTLADQLRAAISEMLTTAWSNDLMRMRLRTMRADLDEVFDDGASKEADEDELERVSEAEIAAAGKVARAQRDAADLMRVYPGARG